MKQLCKCGEQAVVRIKNMGKSTYQYFCVECYSKLKKTIIKNEEE